MNTNEFTIDCILRGLAWKFENQIESFRCLCSAIIFEKNQNFGIDELRNQNVETNSRLTW